MSPTGAAEEVPVNPWMILPFLCLLLAVAVLPSVRREWWERNYPWVVLVLASIPVILYVFLLGRPHRMLQAASDYFSFIVLLGSLFVVSGGLHIRIRGKSTPLANVALLAAGSLAANVLGTTGASMVLVRPFFRVNRYRIRPYHIVFFIFLVSNIGGALTPIGDPPLFLGYLKGVPFFWVLVNVWPVWLLATGSLLLVFFIIDRASFLRFESSGSAVPPSGLHEETTFEGLHNIAFLSVIVLAVFITQPPFLREVLMIGAAAGSWLSTKREVHQRNDFDLLPLKEVAVVFLGIFATMVPAIDYLEMNARATGLATPGDFYWGTGFISSVLDNAPTYLNSLGLLSGLFAAADGGSAGMPFLLSGYGLFIKAISVGAVFFGAATYIGNGPNFMVRSIATQMDIETPSFFGYITKYSLPILGPLFIVVWLLFFR